jgi:hypothetical protein
MPSNPPPVAVALALAVASSIAGASCFSEQPPPSTFRFKCATDGDCQAGERCIDQLCQIPCTLASFEEDCPSAGGYGACVNGVCSSLCTVGSDQCPQPQMCLDLGVALNPGGGFGGASESGSFGVCANPCSSATGCPTGEICLAALQLPLPPLCAQVCVPGADMCPAGFVCGALPSNDHVCVPEGVGLPAATTSDTTGDDGSEPTDTADTFDATGTTITTTGTDPTTTTTTTMTTLTTLTGTGG